MCKTVPIIVYIYIYIFLPLFALVIFLQCSNIHTTFHFKVLRALLPMTLLSIEAQSL